MVKRVGEGRVSMTASPDLAKYFVTQMPTHDLFAVANLVYTSHTIILLYATFIFLMKQD